MFFASLSKLQKQLGYFFTFPGIKNVFVCLFIGLLMRFTLFKHFSAKKDSSTHEYISVGIFSKQIGHIGFFPFKCSSLHQSKLWAKLTRGRRGSLNQPPNSSHRKYFCTFKKIVLLLKLSSNSPFRSENFTYSIKKHQKLFYNNLCEIQHFHIDLLYFYDCFSFFINL